MPKISIITPTYNREKLLQRMLASVLKQTFRDWELILMDDGSTDGTPELMKTYKDSRIKYHFTENSGSSAKRNLGVNYAQGDYIIFLDSDDEAKEDWLDEMVNSIASNELTTCGWQKFNEKGEAREVQMPEKLGGMFDHLTLNYLSGTLLLKKEFFIEAGGYDETLQSGQHTELLIRLLPIFLSHKIRIRVIKKVLIKIHLHDGYRIRHDYNRIFLSSTKTLRKHKEKFEQNPDFHFDYLSVAAVNAMRTKRYDEGSKYFKRSIEINPSDPKGYLRLFFSYIPLLREFIWKK